MWPRVVLAAALVAGAVRAEDYFSGDMTTYTLGQPSAGNCNFMHAPPDAAHDYAAINNPQWAGTKNCGRCALVSCADARCADQSKTKLVYILDQCPECKLGDLDVSPSVFKTLTGSDPSRYKIKWKFVDCPVAGNIQYCLKGGSNPFWTAIQPVNMAAGVTKMTINSQPTAMVASAYYYLLDGQSATQTDLGSVRVTLTSVSGESVTDTVSLSAGQCTEGSSQFAHGGSQTGPGPSPGPPAPAPAPAPAATPSPTTPPATSAPSSPPAPVPTQSPTPTNKEPTPAPSVTPTPTVSPQNQQSNNSTAVSEAGVNEDAIMPGSVRAADDSTMSSREAESRVHKAADEAGVLDAGNPTPASASTSTSTAPTAQVTSSPAGGATQATTRSGTAASTSPAIIVLSVMGVVGVVALTVAAIMVRRKRSQDKHADRDDSFMVVNLRSFDTPENHTGSVSGL